MNTMATSRIRIHFQPIAMSVIASSDGAEVRGRRSNSQSIHVHNTVQTDQA